MNKDLCSESQLSNEKIKQNIASSKLKYGSKDAVEVLFGTLFLYVSLWNIHKYHGGQHPTNILYNEVVFNITFMLYGLSTLLSLIVLYMGWKDCVYKAIRRTAKYSFVIAFTAIVTFYLDLCFYEGLDPFNDWRPIGFACIVIFAVLFRAIQACDTKDELIILLSEWGRPHIVGMCVVSWLVVIFGFGWLTIDVFDKLIPA